MTKDQEAGRGGRSPRVAPADGRIVKLDARNVLKLPAVGDTRTDWRDEIERGLTVRVSPDGHHRVYAVVFRFDGRVRRFTVGPVQDVPLATARERARVLKGKVAHGVDPQAERVKAREAVRETAEKKKAEANRLTVEGLSSLWLASPEAKTWRPATRQGWERFLTAEVVPAIGRKAIEDVRPADVARFLDSIAERSPSSAARCFEVVRAMFRWSNAPKKGGAPLTPNNPCTGLRYVHKAEREKTYSNDELRRIFAAVEGTEVADLVPIIAHTGARSHETRAARWTDVDLERRVWSIPAEDAKSDRRHDVPLSDGAMVVLAGIRERRAESEFLFPAPAKCRTCGRSGHMDPPMKTLSLAGEKAKLGGPLRVHDLRRTVADRLRSDLDVPPHVVDAGVLGHEVPKLWRTYMPTANLAEVRRALDRWSAHLGMILSGKTAKPGKVVPMARR